MMGEFIIIETAGNTMVACGPVRPDPVPAGHKAIAILYGQCGIPQIGGVYTETRSAGEQRRAEYALRLQPLKDALEGQKEDEFGVDEAQSAYDAMRSAIKAEIPLE